MQESKIRLAIIGAGIYGSQVQHWAEISGMYDVIGYFDDYVNNGNMIKGKPVLGNISDSENFYNERMYDQLFIAIGYKHARFKQSLFLSLRDKIPFATIVVSPTYIDITSKIGENVLICPGCILGENSIIDDNVKLSPNVNVSHDSHVGMGTYCSPSVSIAGCTTVGQCCFLGIGSTIVDGIQICDDVTIGAQTLVLRDITEEGTYIGVPARKI